MLKEAVSRNISGFSAALREMLITQEIISIATKAIIQRYLQKLWEWTLPHVLLCNYRVWGWQQVSRDNKIYLVATVLKES